MECCRCQTFNQNQVMSEWKEVRRRPPAFKPNPVILGIRSDPAVTSFFVSNLPGDARKSDLWNQCAKLGNLVDIYIGGRRNAAGFFFAFVRYLDVENPAAIEAGLNDVICKGRKLVANSAKHPGNPSPAMRARPPPVVPVTYARHAPRDRRSFAEVIGKKMSTPAPASAPPVHAISLAVNPEIQEWAANGVLVGTSKNFDVLCNFPSLFDLEGFDVADIKYLGGMNIALKFKSMRAAEIFRSNKNIWLKWFCSLEQFGSNLFRFERIAWVKITGLPPLLWDDGNFSAVVGNVGKVLVQPGSFWNSSDVSTGKLCLLTAYRKKINEEIVTVLDGVNHKVGIFEVEDEWTTFKPFVSNKSDSEDDEGSDEEDDDAVSDTLEHRDMELEEGEIEQQPQVPATEMVFPVNLGSEDGAVGVGIEAVADVEVEAATSSCAHFSETVAIPIGDGAENLKLPLGPTAGNVLENIGPDGPGDAISPIAGMGVSSPDFEVGVSGLKRRRTKKKPRNISKPSRCASSSIDLNKTSKDDQDSRSSPSCSQATSSFSSSSDFAQTIEIGRQVGFQFDPDYPSLVGIVKGGGDKAVLP